MLTDIEDIRLGYVALGLSGYVSAGATGAGATANGEYVRHTFVDSVSHQMVRLYNGKACYTHVDNAMFLWWSIADALWNVTTTLGGATILYKRSAAGVDGAYTNVTGTGALVVTAGTVLNRERRGDGAQTVLREYLGQGHGDLPNTYSRFAVQIACYHTDPKVADARGQAAFAIFDGLKGSTTAAAGWTLSGRTARTVIVSGPLPMQEEMIAGGAILYKQVVNLHLLNLTLT